MAGSYEHCCDYDRELDDAARADCSHLLGPFRFDLIENMGDAVEACEEMHFMIQHLAAGDGRKIHEAHVAYIAATGGDADYARRNP